MMDTLQPLATHAILEQMMLDYFVARRRALCDELTEVNRQLEKLRGGRSAKEDREHVAYQRRNAKQ